MSTPNQLPSQPDPPTSDQTKELLKFLREENEANRTAIRTDAEANRKLLLDTVKLVSIPVGILIVIAGWMGFRSINDLKSTLEADARASTQAEIVRMQEEIRSRLTDQFQTPTLQKLVKDAAAESTRTAAEPLIKSEVASQVKSRVDAEKPTIEAAVTQQTQAAVRQMGPQIDSLVKNSIDTKLTTDIDPVIKRVKDEADLQLLITRVNADDAQAFDVLLQSSFADPSQQTAVFAALRSVVNAHRSGFIMGRSFSSPQTDDQLTVYLSDPEPLNRQAALDTLASKGKPSLLPKVVEMVRSDPSINVRCSAYRLFNNLTRQAFQCLDTTALTWWQNNKQKFVATQ